MCEIWAKLIVAKGFTKLPKVQKIAQSGHPERLERCAYKMPLVLLLMNHLI